MIERLNEQVERESSEKKRIYLKNFFISLLQNSTTKQNYDKRQILLDTLSSITILEFQVLLSKSKEYPDYEIDYSDTNSAYSIAALSRLEMLGLLQSSYLAETRIGSSPVSKMISVSRFGDDFLNFCLNI